MNKNKSHEDLVELGCVSTETKGASVGMDDHQSGLYPQTGLGDE
ncbi:MAG TPA: hypothetical protein VE968_10135 [Sphingomicrobium sp.]|nr:hypothetical protein [Sphingomicrobium sp.]